MTKAEMLAIMGRLDAKANALLLAGSDDMGLFIGMIDDMPEFKALLDSPYKGAVETSGTRFPGLHRYGVVLTNIAQGIADGSIRVPR